MVVEPAVFKKRQKMKSPSPFDDGLINSNIVLLNHRVWLMSNLSSVKLLVLLL